MGNSWQTPDQRDFFDKQLASYTRSCDEKKLKAFWQTVTDDWFKLWPLSEPPAELVAKEGTIEKARKKWRTRKIEQIKRVFKSSSVENAVGHRRNLHLEDGVPRKKSELQMYMILYYDSRIRATVVKRWDEDGVPGLESRVEVNIPENEIEPHESYSLRDPKIPISYKKAIAQKLYEAESEVVKAEVRRQREVWRENGTTIHTEDEDERKVLVREYQRNIPALSRNIGTVLRNAERKCAAKGIVWLSCPSPSRGGQPVAFFQCAGSTPEGQEFEAFLGKEKAEEFKTLFSAWIHKIYPPSEWPFYSLGESTSDGPSTASNLEQDNEEDIDADIDAQQPDPATATLIDVQQLDPVAATLTNVTPSAVSTIPLQPTTTHPAALPEINVTTSTLPSGLPPPSDLHAALANQDQGVLDPKISNHLDHCITRSNDPLTTIDDLPTSATESAWMKSKKTLKYFREAHKMGRLSDLILHWYQLEEVLGFQETTPKGFPSDHRPQVLRTFFKNGHNYKKDYGLEAKSLGAEIIRWWEEIKATGGVANVRFGGPTGIYNLVVLMTWWCLLLKGQPDDESTDCLRTLEDIDCAVSSAFRDTNYQPPIAPSPALLATSTTLPARQPRGSKRTISEEEPSRKRLRSA